MEFMLHGIEQHFGKEKFIKLKTVYRIKNIFVNLDEYY